MKDCSSKMRHLRDGLQMESRIFSLQEKLHVFQLLKDAGIKRIQVGSFVHPKDCSPDGPILMNLYE